MARKPPPAHAPYLPVPYELADAYAIRAVAGGTADADQQRRAIRWLVDRAAGTYELEFRPEGERESIFASGRRFVGLQLVKLINLDGRVLDAMRRGAGAGSPSEQG